MNRLQYTALQELRVSTRSIPREVFGTFFNNFRSPLSNAET